MNYNTGWQQSHLHEGDAVCGARIFVVFDLNKAETQQTIPNVEEWKRLLTVRALQTITWLLHQHLLVLTSSTVGILLPAACRAPHRAESLLHAWLSRTCSSIWFKCFTMSRDKPSSERMNTSITCRATSSSRLCGFLNVNKCKRDEQSY